MLYADFVKKLDSFDLHIQIESDGGVLGIFGASGAGKSMALKCIAGIEKPDSGVIRLNDRVLFDSEKRVNLKPQERRVGYLFQEYALFPNMTARQNIEAGLHRMKPKEKRKAEAERLMREYRIAHLSDRRPDKLSGGERQRVALARLFAAAPELLLLDEPFSSLDTLLKCELIPLMKDAISAYGKGCLMVSHDVNELDALCDSVTTVCEGENSPIIPIEDFLQTIKDKYSSLKEL